MHSMKLLKFSVRLKQYLSVGTNRLFLLGAAMMLLGVILGIIALAQPE